MDSGATAYDIYDGDITTGIVVTNPVNTSILGDYIITYDINDSHENTATTVTRIVHVVDTTKPVITLLGSGEITVEAYSPYTDSGVTVTDNYDGSIITGIIVTNPVNTESVGKYTITYDVADAQGNSAISVNRIVHVVNSFNPTITLAGDNPQIIEL